jgi:UDP-N-acetyl-D-glucosamine dehydrogenase
MPDIAVIVGLSYGGMLLARGAVRSGPRVIGLDPNEEIVAGLEAGRSNIDDVTDNDIVEMKCGRFCVIAHSNVICPGQSGGDLRFDAVVGGWPSRSHR